MKNRSIPLGYMLDKGKISIEPSEAKTVDRIFLLYEQGLSFLEISRQLTESSVPYIDGEPRWNKNNVSRILRNTKYTGADGYPPIVNEDRFMKVQQMLADKTSKWATPIDDPSRVLWQRIRCAECGCRLLRIGGKLAGRGIVQLRCENRKCGNGIDIPLTELYKKIQCAKTSAQAERATEVSEYEPSPELLRLTNEIGRRLEKPDDPTEIRKLILRAAAARYEQMEEAQCSTTNEYEDTDRPDSIDWKMFHRTVSHISIDRSHAVTAQLI